MSQNDDNEYIIPANVRMRIQVALANHSENEAGLKRAKFILNNKLKFGELKRLKNFFDHPENISSEAEYLMAGGDEMKNWIELQLQHDRNAVKNVKKSRQTNDKALNKGTLKIQTGQPLRESAGDSTDKAAIAVLIDPDQKLLLVQRSDESDWEPGKWALPGGMVKTDEDTADAIRREVKEELGIDIDRVIEKFSIRKDDLTEFVFYSIIPSNSEVEINEESKDFGFFTLEEISKKAENEETVPYLEDYISLVLDNELKD